MVVNASELLGVDLETLDVLGLYFISNLLRQLLRKAFFRLLESFLVLSVQKKALALEEPIDFLVDLLLGEFEVEFVLVPQFLAALLHLGYFAVQVIFNCLHAQEAGRLRLALAPQLHLLDLLF